jgi:hypothetical protein
MKDENLRIIFDNCFTVSFNMNDKFYYACGDSSEIDHDDLEDLEPVMEAHGRYALIAYEAFKRGQDPTVTQIALDPRFVGAKSMIKDMLDIADGDTLTFWDLRRTIMARESSVSKKVEEAIENTLKLNKSTKPSIKDRFLSIFGAK